ncbi:MAG: S8 family serine peptidase, partial [Bacteroidia bacterium]|nr:S8 family serine peptidase [Bacteroidia bacterium]
MRKLLFFLFIGLQFLFFSQQNCSAYLKASVNSGNLPSTFDVFVKGNIDYLISNASLLGIKVNYYAGDIASVRTNVNSLANLLLSKHVSFVEYNYKKVESFNDTMLVKNRIKAVKQGAAPLAQAYDGTGVIMGIMDTGIDFNHPDFKLSNGNTRVQFIWDQNQTSGSTVPAPYNYGIEWTAAQINASLCTHSDLSGYGHGTHVSGTAAGNGLATGTHEGIASQADLVVVAMNFNSPNNIFADAVNYIFSKATALSKPCVINASVGNYYGSHDGTDLETQLINNMLNASNGRVLVAAAGNAGNYKYHAKTNINTTDTNFTWLKTNATTIYHLVYADTAQFKNIKMSIAANSPNFQNLGRTPIQSFTYGLSGQKIDTLKNNGNRIGIIKTSSSINSFGVYERFFQIIPDSNNYYWRVEATGNGLYDAWNFDFVSTNLPSVSQYSNIVNYIMPDTISTIVSGFQCSDEVITVGNYINKNTWYDVTNTLQNSGEVQGKIKETSSGGPTRDNRIKPEVVATGANVFAAMALGMQANLVANAPSAVAPGSM